MMSTSIPDDSCQIELSDDEWENVTARFDEEYGIEELMVILECRIEIEQRTIQVPPSWRDQFMSPRVMYHGTRFRLTFDDAATATFFRLKHL